MFIVVDLPEPEGPITATKSPASMSRSTPFSAWNAVAPSPKVLLMPGSWISGGPLGMLAPATRSAACAAAARATALTTTAAAARSAAPLAGARGELAGNDLVARLELAAGHF